MAGVRIRALTTPRLIKLTSTRCRSARQLNIGRRSTYQGGDSVQTTGATSGEMTLSQLAEHFDVHPNQITTWKSLLQEGAADVFGGGSGGSTQPAVDVKSLHAKIGELTLENDFLEGALSKAGLLSARR